MRHQRQFINTILGVVIGVGACSQAPMTAPDQRELRVLPPLSAFQVSPTPMLGAAGDLGNTSPYLRCKPLKHDKKAQGIDAKGGSLDIGPHTLVIPPGALAKKTWITAEILGDDVNSIKFSPEGLQFLAPTYLFMSYQNCGAGGPGSLEVVYASDDLAMILQQLPSVDIKSAGSVVALVTHFSRYAVAY
jgi:hypothetical protein